MSENLRPLTDEEKKARERDEEIQRKLELPLDEAEVQEARETIKLGLDGGILIDFFLLTPGELVDFAESNGVSPASFQKAIEEEVDDLVKKLKRTC